MTRQPLSPARGKAVVAILALGAMVSSLQFTLTVPILAEIPDLLNVTTADAAWLIIATLLSSTVSTPIMTRLADLYGRKKVLLISLILLVVGSMIAALGMTFFTVIVGRVLQGFSSSVVPIGVSLIHTHVNTKQANMGVALLSGTIGIGSSLGLPLSGYLMDRMGLPGVFWISAVAGSIFIVLIAIVVPEAPDRLPKKLDPWSTLWLSVWLTALTLVISKGNDWGWLSMNTLVGSFLFVMCLLLWLRSSLTSPHAVIDVRLALGPAIRRINLASFLTTFGMFTNHLITMQEARAPSGSGIGLNLPVSQAGLLLLPFSLTMLLTTPVTGWAINRFGARFALIVGATIMGCGFAYRVLQHGTLTTVITGTLIVGVGTSFAFSSMPALVTQASPAAELASANGVNGLVRSLSGAIASSVYALIMVSFPSAINPEFLSETGQALTFSAVSIACLAGAAIGLRVPKRYQLPGK